MSTYAPAGVTGSDPFAYAQMALDLAQHGTARGPMLDVIANLRAAPDDDVRAIADYVAAQIGKPTRRSEQIQLTERAGQPPARQEADLQAQRGTLIAATSADRFPTVPPRKATSLRPGSNVNSQPRPVVSLATIARNWAIEGGFSSA